MYQIVCGIVLLSKGESCEKSAHAPRSCRDAKWHVRSPMVRQDSKWHAGNRRAEPTQTKWNAGSQESRADAYKRWDRLTLRRRRTNHRRGLSRKVAKKRDETRRTQSTCLLRYYTECVLPRLRVLSIHVHFQVSSRRGRTPVPWRDTMEGARGADELKTSHMISGMAYALERIRALTRAAELSKSQAPTAAVAAAVLRALRRGSNDRTSSSPFPSP